MDFNNIKITLKCNINNNNNNNNNNNEFNYVLFNNNNNKFIDYNTIRNRDIYRKIKDNLNIKNINDISEKQKTLLTSELNYKKKLIMPYSENYIDETSFKIYVNNKKETIGNSLDDYRIYVSKLLDNKKLDIGNINFNFDDDSNIIKSDDNTIFLKSFIDKPNKYIFNNLIDKIFSDSDDLVNNKSLDTSLNEIKITDLKQLSILIDNVEYIKQSKKPELTKIFKSRTSQEYGNLLIEKFIKNLINNIYYKNTTIIDKANNKLYNFRDNILDLFLTDDDQSSYNTNKKYIEDLFNEFNESLLESINRGRSNIKNINNYSTVLNNESDKNNILLNNAKYFIDSTTLSELSSGTNNTSSSNKDTLILDYLNSNNKVKDVITYYNIYNILSKLINNNSILFIDKASIENKDYYKNSVYFKILNFNKTNIVNLVKNNKNNELYLDVLFQVTLEKLNLLSNIEFKTKITNILTNSTTVKDHNISLFDISNNTNNTNKIYIDHKLNYNKVLSNFNKIKTFFKINDPREIFINDKIFKSIISKSIYKNINIDIKYVIKNFYVDKLFFKKDNILKIDNYNYTYGKIINVDIGPIDETLNQDILFMGDDNTNKVYNVTLNVQIYPGKTKDIKISLKNKILYTGKCSKRANMLDNTLNNILKNKNNISIFKNLLKNKSENKKKFGGTKKKKNKYIKKKHIISHIKKQKNIVSIKKIKLKLSNKPKKYSIKIRKN